VAAAVTIASTPIARADDPSAGALQVRLVESRMHLNDLYARAAAASERLNGATYELEQAKADVRRQRLAVQRSRKLLAAQRQAVAALTVQQLQTDSGPGRLSALFDSDGPEQLLERAGAYASTNEAMNARVDALDARRVVHDSAVARAEKALAAQQEAARRRQTAAAEIDRAIKAAESAVATQEKERKRLLGQLARVQDVPLAEVTEKQDRIDERLDASGPGEPPPPAADPQPDPKPSPTPTKPKPKPTPPPPADPPPASSSKVETAIAFAMAQLGEPYKYGGAGPSSWDCSGLVMRAWQAAGVNLPHYAGAQYAQTKHVSVSKIRRGDLIYWSNGGAGSIYHVAIYLGGGKMIQAPRTGRNVEVVSLSYWIQPDLASRPG
jgi:cell wall-associated NlpC family hydrolase